MQHFIETDEGKTLELLGRVANIWLDIPVVSYKSCSYRRSEGTHYTLRFDPTGYTVGLLEEAPGEGYVALHGRFTMVSERYDSELEDVESLLINEERTLRIEFSKDILDHYGKYTKDSLIDRVIQLGEMKVRMELESSRDKYYRDNGILENG